MGRTLIDVLEILTAGGGFVWDMPQNLCLEPLFPVNKRVKIQILVS